MTCVKKIAIASLTILVALFSISQMTYAKEWDARTTDKVDKVWKVQFSKQIDGLSLNENSVYVTDGVKNHPTTLRVIDDGYTLEVSPDKDYQPGKLYKLNITSLVKSLDGKLLKTPVEFPFQVVVLDANIQSVTSVSGGIITNITVKTSADVYKVKISGEEIHYKGNNIFSYGFVDLKTGTVLTVYAYDENNKLLKSIKYTVGS